MSCPIAAFACLEEPTRTGPSNPAEYLNNDTKHAILAKQRPADKTELVGAARRHLHRRQKQPAVVRSFFRHPDIAYAA